MPDLIRFGLAMEEPLLRQFDDFISRKGYTNRSEAVRDIARSTLNDERVQTSRGTVFGALVYIYQHHAGDVQHAIADLQHKHSHNIISTSHVHIDDEHCFEVVLLRGRASALQSFADRLLAFKGVSHGRLTLTTPLKGLHRHAH